MKISTLEEYAVRCLSQLARAEGKLTIGAIAELEGLSEENTAKVMARLRSMGLARSLRGKDGGYLLARPAEQISLAEVLEGVAGELFQLERCHGDRGDRAGCVHHAECSLRPMWARLEQVVHDFLSALTIADLLREESAMRNVVRALSHRHPALELSTEADSDRAATSS
ncbi:MAG: Rrf2 family transcriptional regulator [Acidobacteriota bacterium]|nr:Rrf2 family transcriptional regulator [Acidobacteriota bacterium]MDQ7086738.1 Rrf2 family transcriptional regulator [Acidobacteriota bacterium]